MSVSSWYYPFARGGNPPQTRLLFPAAPAGAARSRLDLLPTHSMAVLELRRSSGADESRLHQSCDAVAAIRDERNAFVRQHACEERIDVIDPAGPGSKVMNLGASAECASSGVHSGNWGLPPWPGFPARANCAQYPIAFESASRLRLSRSPALTLVQPLRSAAAAASRTAGEGSFSAAVSVSTGVGV
jgi:hypothetical protein